MANKWLTHIKKTMKTMKSRGTYKKGMGLKQVIMEAKKSWHKAKKGGAEDELKDVDLSLKPATGDASASDSVAPLGKGATAADAALAQGGRRRKTRRRHSRRR